METAHKETLKIVWDNAYYAIQVKMEHISIFLMPHNNISYDDGFIYKIEHECCIEPYSDDIIVYYGDGKSVELGMLNHEQICDLADLLENIIE